MKGIKKGLAILLVLCTLLSMVVMTGAGTADTAQDAPTAQSADNFLRIFSLDCGRIYFSVDQIKGIIRELAANDYTHLQLAFGNGGLRFLLNDMSVTVGGTKYESDDVKNAIQAGNTYYAANDGHGGSQAANTCLTQAEMDGIISYASSNGIQIIPLLNSPGHMNAIVYAMGQLGISNAGYPVNGVNSPSTVNIGDETVKAFVTALIQKYITYFSGKDCTYFHMGADEFANDPTDGANTVGFTADIKENFVSYVNSIADKVTNAGMTPVMFNDGYAWTNADFDPSIVVSYWTRGSVPSTQIAKEGHQIINTNQAWYYVLGSPFQSNWCSYASATNGVNNTSVTSLVDGGSVGEKLIGATMCFWCDFTNQTYTESEQTNVATLIRTLATNNPTYFTVQQEDTITVVLNGTKEVGVSSDNITEQPNSTYASVEIEPTEMTTGKYVQVDSIESGKKYILVNQGVYVTTGATTNGSGVSGLTCASFSASDTTGSYNASRWTITETNGGYTIKNANGKYLNVASSNGNANVTLTKNEQALTISDLGTTFTIANGRTYFDRFDENFAAGWGGSNAGPGNNNEQWALYEYQEAPAYTMTVTGNAIGTTYVTVGNVRYPIHVVEEDLDQAPSLTYHPWISNLAIYPDDTGSDNCTLPEGEARPVTIPATQSGVYSEQGVAFSTLVAPTGDWRWEGTGIETYFWKGTVLPNGSHQCGDDQADNKKTDMSMSGTDFTYLRYWGGDWSYSSDRVNWTKVTDTDEVCAYYLQKTAVTTEVDTYVKDWAFTTRENAENTSNGGQKALSFAVVYPDGTMATEDDIYNSSTLIYWANLDDIGFIRVQTNENYDVSKITYTFGQRINSSGNPYSESDASLWLSTDRINWSKTTDGAYNETVCWDTTYGTEPVVNGDNMRTIPVNADQPDQGNHTGRYYDGSWGTNDAVLILIYLDTKVTEDSLAVHYIDQTANQEFYSYNIAVKSGTLFHEKIGLAGSWKGNLANGSVTNLQDKTQTVSADLSTMPAIGAQYRYSDYTCVKVERSEDGKDVYLYYTFNNAHSFVVDFGLPVKITTQDLGISGDWTSISVSGAQYGTATATVGEGLTYTPTQTIKDIETLQLTLTDSTGSVTHQIYIYPATTVYYEEGFAVPYAGKGIVAGSKGTATQTAEAAGEKTYVYGYDPAYANTIPNELAGGAIMLDASGEGVSFEFTGTGVDIYTNSSPATGTVMVYVYKGTGSSKVFQRLITVDTAMRNGTTDATASQNVTAYNVPIVSLAGLEHGTYTVEVDVVMSKVTNSDNTTTKSLLPVYIDGFRVHGTLENQANDVYTADQEDSPVFIELRDQVLASLNATASNSAQYADQIAKNIYSQVYATAETTEGVVITSKPGTYTDPNLTDLLDNGPKNEIYLQPNQALTFKITTDRVVQVGLKALDKATTYAINNGTVQSLNASTDMFYTVLNKAENATEQTITITNKGEGILSITKLKVCDDPNATLGELTAEDLIPALVSLGYETEPVEAEAVLNITVQAGDQTVTAQLTATGIEGESHTFTAAEIKAAAEAALPEGYTLDGVTFEDVTVVCGAQGETSYTAAAVQNPTPDQPTKVLQKLLAVIKNIFERLFRWL